MKMMRAVTERGFPLTLNVVLHRLNIDRMREICEFCASMNPSYVELASAQMHGWALKNRNVLLPTPEQVSNAQAAIREYQATSDAGVFYVLPDLIEKKAKNCHNGWGELYMCVNPQGDVAPCLSAHIIPEVKGVLQNVHTSSMADIWESGKAFQMYRGLDWMIDDDARTHPRRAVDGSGCRCQAYALTGDARNMDPACETSMHHPQFLRWMEEAFDTPTDIRSLVPRRIK